jgi:curli biogenesis system outer membrane secretion channel CsgG
MKRFVMLAVLFVCGTSTAFAGVKKLAVLDFEDTSTASAPDISENPFAALAMLRGGQQQPQQDRKIGKSISNILVTELVKDGSFKIVERSQLERILGEQKLGKDAAISASEAVKLGKLLGVSAVIVGSVTEYNTKTETKGFLGVGRKVKTAKVAVNARIVDTSTGEIIFAAEGKGEEEESNVTVGSVYGSDTTGASDTLLSAATKKALTGIIQTLKDNTAKLKEQTLEGYVVNIDNNDKSIMIDLGSDSGLVVGQCLYVVKVIKEIKSQTTGEVIKKITSLVGELKVRDIEKQVATCICVNGTCDTVKENDRVSSIK